MAETTLHVVFGSSPAGIVRQALSELGRREQVLDLMDDLSLGPIASSDPEVRGSWFDKELGASDWREITGWREIVSEDALLPAKSAGHGRLIAWYAPNRAASYAGFKWWLSQVNTAPVSIMSVPDLHFEGTDAMKKLVGQEIELSDDDRNRHQADWRSLKDEDAPLRIVQDGTLVSAPLDYFDDLIMRFVTAEWQPVLRVVGDAFSSIGVETGHIIGDLFTSSRIRAFARSGVIEWDGDMADRRGSRVRLTGSVSNSKPPKRQLPPLA